MNRLLILLLVVLSTSSFATGLVKDPLGSVQWDDMYRAFLNGHPAVFDNKVKLIAPSFAEDPMNVPVTVDARGLSDIKQIVIFADFNPIPLIARFYPTNAEPLLSFRFKIQQASPVRAAVLTGDGQWHVAGSWVNSAGGGCTAASTGRLVGNWMDYLGEVYGKRWTANNSNRIRFLIKHPMDTGLASGIPEFYIEHLNFTNESGDILAHLELFEPINENPVLSLNFNSSDRESAIYMTGSDNNGNEFEAVFSQ
ncbi:MAG: quinoprotein dehydrogenase-associated SoxYZ-like carrier [Piscirickettsiaceae bacterium]|nr:MAG: quinoprotein dehydrogenase-associated SoxYZ-like carrier [Piscirickettsiaceae bacterium]PCI69469.1 MAG: quinoprotein dehydrogenase-associated SoxYZ-like carrier [Piscirickettsiaceae bacterium]